MARNKRGVALGRSDHEGPNLKKDALGGPTHLAKGTCPRPAAQNGDQGSGNALRKACSNSPRQVGHRVRLTEVALTDG